MKLTLESTAEIVMLDGVPSRVWHGTTGTGAPCVVYVSRLLVAVEKYSSDFDRELLEAGTPKRRGEFA